MNTAYRLAVRTVVLASVLAIVLISILALSTPRAVLAHEAPCPYCKLTLTQNTDKIDNEVAVLYGNKRIEYRCVYCAFADQGRYKGDLTIKAPGEKKGVSVILKRTGDKWSAPDSTVFLSSFRRHKTCAVESRVFSSRSAFDAYVKENGITDAKPLTLADELADVAKKSGNPAADSTRR